MPHPPSPAAGSSRSLGATLAASWAGSQSPQEVRSERLLVLPERERGVMCEVCFVRVRVRARVTLRARVRARGRVRVREADEDEGVGEVEDDGERLSCEG